LLSRGAGDPIAYILPDIPSNFNSSEKTKNPLTEANGFYALYEHCAQF
jgi:hypothetical protein